MGGYIHPEVHPG